MPAIPARSAFHRRLRVLLAQQDLTQRELARRLGISDPWLCLMLRERYRMPKALPARMEKALGLVPGTLSVQQEEDRPPGKAA